MTPGRALVRGPLGALLGCSLAVLAACGGTPAPAGSAPPPSPTSQTPSAPRTIVVTPIPLPPGIRLSFIQQRIDEGTPRSQVRVINGTDHSLQVRSVGVDWAGYPLRLHRVDYDVPGQATLDLRYRLPPAVCTAAARRGPIRAVAVTGSHTIRRPMRPDGVRFLTRLWTTECNARRLQAAVHVRYGDRFVERRRGGRLVLHGTLELTRQRGEQDIRVSQVQGSVLYELSTPGATELAPDRGHASVPLAITDGGRCDPHSLGQSTQSFLFRVWLRLDGGPQIARILEPTRPQQRRLQRFLDHACAGIS